MNKRIKILLGGVGTVAVGLMLPGEVLADGDSVIDEIGVEVPVSCTMSGAGMASHTEEIINSTYEDDIGTTTLHALCNDSEGFAIYATGYTGNTIGETNSNKLIGSSTGETIVTGTATTAGNPDISNWAMKLAISQDSGDTTGTNAFTIDNSFNTYQSVPNSYTKVAHKDSSTDMAASLGGVKLTTTYAAYISKTQPADTYSGQVIYKLVHPSNEEPLSPQAATPGCINYFANASNAIGTMGCQSATDNASVELLASNFSRTGYGFAGWSDAYDYVTNFSAHFYGPQETITAPEGTTANGFSLYAVWVKSAGNLQDTDKVAELCGTGTNALVTAPTDGTANLSSVSALTDQRDNQTYAIAKLADDKCWMIENLRLDDSATLTLANTNNPLNDGTNVTLKHNYTDTDTSNTLSATSSVAYNADTAPDGWCTTNSAACDDQSRLRTDNTANRATNNPNTNSSAMYSYGNYYNWYSATAGRGTYGFSTNNNSTAGDLCPSGWRLPKGGNKTRIESNDDNDFWNLIVDALNGGTNPANYDSSTYPYYNGSTEAGPVAAKLRSYPNNYLYSGYVSGGSLNDRGSYGFYWSSTANTNINAYYLYLNSSRVSPGTYNVYKYYGRALRCIASS